MNTTTDTAIVTSKLRNGGYADTTAATPAETDTATVSV
jgi:hypothetical protein